MSNFYSLFHREFSKENYFEPEKIMSTNNLLVACSDLEHGHQKGDPKFYQRFPLPLFKIENFQNILIFPSPAPTNLMLCRWVARYLYVTNCRNFSNLFQKFLSEILTWESMRNFFIYILNGAGKSVKPLSMLYPAVLFWGKSCAIVPITHWFYESTARLYAYAYNLNTDKEIPHDKEWYQE